MRWPGIRAATRWGVVMLGASLLLLVWWSASMWLSLYPDGRAGPFQRAIRVGMSRAEVLGEAGPPAQILAPGSVLGSWGGCPERTVPCETLIYFRGIARIDRFAVMIEDGRVVRVVHDET